MDAVEQLTATFAALADPTRRDIVVRLAAEDGVTVSDLAAPYDITVQAVSKHVAVLQEAGIVTRSREAQRRPVHLDARVLSMLSAWLERTRQRAEDRYRRLDGVLEELAAHDGDDPAVGPTGPVADDHPQGDDT